MSWNGERKIDIKASNPTWKKWLPSWPTSAHWYDQGRFRRYMAAHIAHRGDITVREFISEFRGMTGDREAEGGAGRDRRLARLAASTSSDCRRPTPTTSRSCWRRSRSTASQCGRPSSASSARSISIASWKRPAAIPRRSPTSAASARPAAFRGSLNLHSVFTAKASTAQARGPEPQGHHRRELVARHQQSVPAIRAQRQGTRRASWPRSAPTPRSRSSPCCTWLVRASPTPIAASRRSSSKEEGDDGEED